MLPLVAVGTEELAAVRAPEDIRVPAGCACNPPRRLHHRSGRVALDDVNAAGGHEIHADQGRNDAVDRFVELLHHRDEARLRAALDDRAIRADEDEVAVGRDRAAPDTVEQVSCALRAELVERARTAPIEAVDICHLSRADAIASGRRYLLSVHEKRKLDDPAVSSFAADDACEIGSVAYEEY